MTLKPIWRLIILFMILQNEVLSSLQRNLILDYYKRKFIRKIVIFSCDNNLDNMDLSRFLMDNTLYTSIYNTNHMKYNITEILYIKHDHLGIVMDADCKNIPTILKQCADLDKFRDKFMWLIFSKTNDIFQILSQITININAEITIAFPVFNHSFWKLLDVYNSGFKHNGTLKTTKLGEWNPKTGFIIEKIMYVDKYWRRKNLTGVYFTGIIAFLNKFPGELLEYLYNNDSNRTVDNFTRLQFILWGHVRDIYNFTILIPRYLSAYGTLLPNGSFNGLIGVIERKEADLSLAPVYYKSERVSSLDFLTPTYKMKTRFIFRYPKPAITIRGTFFSPLSSQVWLCTWGIMILTALIVRLVFKKEHDLQKSFSTSNDLMEYDLSYISLLIFGGICQQDVPRVPNLYSGRTIVFTSVLFTYMLYQFYSGGIVSSLLSEPPRFINNLNDLLHSSLKIGIENYQYQKDYLALTTEPIARELYRTRIANQKNESSVYYSTEDGIELVRKGGFAFHSDTCKSYEIIEQTYPNDIICELGEVELYPSQWLTGIIVQDSPFRELFVYGFQRLTEAGLVYRTRLRWSTRKPECIKVADSSSIYVGMKEFFPALLFYAIGILISLILFALEHVVQLQLNKKAMIAFKKMFVTKR